MHTYEIVTNYLNIVYIRPLKISPQRAALKVGLLTNSNQFLEYL